MTFWMYSNFEYIGFLEGNVLIICDEGKCKHIMTTLEPVGNYKTKVHGWLQPQHANRGGVDVEGGALPRLTHFEEGSLERAG